MREQCEPRLAERRSVYVVGAASSRDDSGAIREMRCFSKKELRHLCCRPLTMSQMSCRTPHGRNLRKGRSSQVGRFYFLTTVVADRRPIFHQRVRAEIMIDAIRWLSAAHRFIVDAAVVMPDHVHLVGQLGMGSRLEAAPTDGLDRQSASRLEAAPALAKVMHTLKSYTANRLASSGVPAPVWQRGYHDHGLRDDEDYCARVRYVLDNPVRAGFLEGVSAYPYVILPEGWNRDGCSASRG